MQVGCCRLRQAGGKAGGEAGRLTRMEWCVCPVQSSHLNHCCRRCRPHSRCLLRAGSRNRKLASVTPQPGLALLHKHGDYCLEHEGVAVTAGIKYVLRSDVVFQRR